jgi:hypothetical protein
MDKKNKIFLVVFLFLISISITLTFYNIAVKKNFTIFTNEEDIPSSMDYLKEKLWKN